MASTKDRDYPSFTDKYVSDALIESAAHLILLFLIFYLLGAITMFWYFLLNPTSFDAIVTFDLLWKIQTVTFYILIFRLVSGLYSAIVLLEPGEGPVWDCRM